MGVRFDAIGMEEAVSRIRDFAFRNDRPRYVCTGNLDHLRMVRTDSDFFSIYEDADMVLADGMPVVWLSKSTENPLPERVAGVDLVKEVVRMSAHTGARIFFLGGSPGSVEKAREKLMKEHPTSNIVGSFCPSHENFDSPQEQSRILHEIRRERPNVLLVAFGAPKQEKWIRRNLHALKVPVSIGVGGSFEMLSDSIERSPVVLQRAGLEWLWRFGQEPNRLFGRYFLRGIPFFCWALLTMWVGRMKLIFDAGP
jgi:N-acetylglucosaminyldiphosphoundecaprenol N-acetyl-beta-D-mannosaminyltransferase